MSSMPMMRRRVWAMVIPVVLAGLVVGQCSKKSAQPTTSSSRTYPLTIGTEWVYEIAQAYWDTLTAAKYRYDTITATITDTMRLSWNDELAAVMAFAPGHPDPHGGFSEMYVTSTAMQRATPVDTVRFISMTEFYSVLVFPLPDSGHWEELCNDYAVVGDSAIAIDSSSTIRCRAVSTYRSFGIPCDVYSGYYRRLDWIAPGIGMVYASHTVIGCPCDIPAHFVSKTIWRLLSYHTPAP